jgi:outer membrane protein, multidrug efflux system
MKMLRNGRLMTVLPGVAALSACTITPQPLDPEQHAQLMLEDMERLSELSERESLPQVVTLDVAIERALSHNLESRLFRLNEVLASDQLRSVRMDMLPQLVAGAGFVNRDRDYLTVSRGADDEAAVVDPSQSQDRRRRLADVGLNWNILDFGLSYFAAKQNADRVLIAEQQRRRVSHQLVQEVRSAYWRVATAEPFEQRNRELIVEARQALDDARRIESERLSPVIEVLRVQRELVELIRSLEAVQYQQAADRATLASLLGLPPNTRFILDLPDADQLGIPGISLTVEKMEEVALFNRPELTQERYEARIARLEARMAMLRLLPGINLGWSAYYDSNSFLVNNQWTEATGRITANLLALATAGPRVAPFRSNEEVARMRRLALSMGVLTQVHVSYQNFLSSVEEFNQLREVGEIEQRIFGHISRGADVDSRSDLERIRSELNAIYGQVNSYRAYALMQRAHADLMNAMGLDAPRVDAPATVFLVDPGSPDAPLRVDGAAGWLEVSGNLGLQRLFAIEGGERMPHPVEVMGGVYDVRAVGRLGELYLDSRSGEYRFVPNETAVRSLRFGEEGGEQFVVRLDDQVFDPVRFGLSVAATGAGNAARIDGVAEGEVIDGAMMAAVGRLSVTDPDAGEARLAEPAAADLVGEFGTFALDPVSGGWTYTLSADSARVAALPEGALAEDRLRVSSLDGSASEEIVVRVVGTNREAAISGQLSAELAAAEGARVTGRVLVSDPDAGEGRPAPVPAAALAGAYGEFSFDADTGVWTYTVDALRPVVTALPLGSTVVDTLDVSSVDGTARVSIEVSVAGVNDAPVFEPVAMISVPADATMPIDGQVRAVDVDAGAVLRYALAGGRDLTAAERAAGSGGYDQAVDGTYGRLLLDAVSGRYRYLPDATAIAALALDARAEERFQVTVADEHGAGDATVIAMALRGVNHPPTLAEVTDAVLRIGEGTPGEPADVTGLSGVLQADDVDQGAVIGYGVGVEGGRLTRAATGMVRVRGRYGALHLDTVSGRYEYTPNERALRRLDELQEVEERFVFVARDERRAESAPRFWVVRIEGPTPQVVDDGDASSEGSEG